MPRRTSRDIRSDSMVDVLHAVLSAGETTRNEIAHKTGLSAATVVTIAGELIDRGIIVETKTTAGQVGRPTAVLAINAERGRVVGLDVAETYVRGVMFDASLNPLTQIERAHDEHLLDPDSIVEAIGLVLDDLLVQVGSVGQVQPVVGPHRSPAMADPEIAAVRDVEDLLPEIEPATERQVV